MPVIALFLASGKKFHTTSSVFDHLFTWVAETEQSVAPPIGWNPIREGEVLLTVLPFYSNSVKLLSCGPCET